MIYLLAIVIAAVLWGLPAYLIFIFGGSGALAVFAVQQFVLLLVGHWAKENL